VQLWITGCICKIHGYDEYVQHFSFYLTIFLSVAHNGRMIMDLEGHGRI
jgi:hypothetical protein